LFGILPNGGRGYHQPNPFIKKQEINKSLYKKTGNVPNLTLGMGGGVSLHLK